MRRLPRELRWGVAEQLLCEYATVQLSVLHIEPASVNKFTPTSRVWARFVLFEGVKYLESLSNICDGGKGEVELKTSQRIVDTLYVCQDHLGILEVIIANSVEVPKIAPRPGVWWTSFKTPNCPLKAQSDVCSLTKTCTDL